jgi:Ca-activated chloride channel family protein
MSFAQPAVLVLLVGPAWLLGRVWRRAGRRLALPFDHGRQRPGTAWRVAIDLAESVPALVLAVAVLLLAGPQRTGEPKTKRKLTNIEFCVDVSFSMLTPFGDGTRYDTSMKAINDFLDYRKGDAFGLTFFGNAVLHWVPLTSDVSAFRCAPPFMKPNHLPPWFGGTEIAKALLACKDVLAGRDEGDRMIILVTDGISIDLMAGNDEVVAETLKRHNITVNAVHIADTDVPPPVVTITSRTGGEVYNPGDPEALKAVFRRIDAMRQTPMVTAAAESQDDFGPFCAAGLALLGAFGAASFGLRYTPW